MASDKDRYARLLEYIREMYDLDAGAWNQCLGEHWGGLFLDGFDDDEVLSICMDGYGVSA